MSGALDPGIFQQPASRRMPGRWSKEAALKGIYYGGRDSVVIPWTAPEKS
jgi:hypothetical protein